MVIAAIFVIIWNISLYFLPSHTTTANYLYNVGYACLYFIGAVVGIRASLTVSTKSSLGKTLLYLALGNAGYGMGLVTWAYYNVIARIEVPFPSLADFFFLFCFIPCMAIGLIHLLRIYGIATIKQYIRWGIVIFGICGLIILGFIMKPDVSRDLPILTRAFNIAYPLGDTLLLTGAILALLSGGGKLSRGILILTIGYVFQVSADFVFAYRTTAETYWNGDISDLLFTISGATLSLAIITIAAHFQQQTSAKPQIISSTEQIS